MTDTQRQMIAHAVLLAAAAQLDLVWTEASADAIKRTMERLASIEIVLKAVQ